MNIRQNMTCKLKHVDGGGGGFRTHSAALFRSIHLQSLNENQYLTTGQKELIPGRSAAMGQIDFYACVG